MEGGASLLLSLWEEAGVFQLDEVDETRGAKWEQKINSEIAEIKRTSFWSYGQENIYEK